ncbi:MAG: aldo/keto reductase [Syntrophobacteraceae bacterium]
MECLRTGPVYSLQPPYNIFERQAEKKVLPFCVENEIPTLVYGGLCRGLLTGKFTGNETFPRGDLRRRRKTGVGIQEADDDRHVGPCMRESGGVFR